MSNIPPHAVPYKTAFVPQYSLYLPLQHLLGNKIGFVMENSDKVLVHGKLDISFWKFEKDQPYAGRIHIFPTPGLELRLIEDFSIGKMPEDYPKIGERTTSKDEVNISLYYTSQEFWNFRIHYIWNGAFTDKEAKQLIAEGRIDQIRVNQYRSAEEHIYNPPREVIQLPNGKWATKPN